MDKIADIILSIIDQFPWISLMYVCNKVYQNKPKHTVIDIPNKISIKSDR